MKELLKKFGELVLGLVMEKNNGDSSLSLGRLTFLVVIAEFIYLWHCKDTAVPGGLMEVFYVLAGYVFGSKAVDMVKFMKKSPEITSMEIPGLANLVQAPDEISQLPKGSDLDIDVNDLGGN